MLNDGFQYLEQRDTENNITHEGVVGKYSAFATSDNKGIFDIVAEDLRALYDDMSSLGLAKLKQDITNMYNEMKNDPNWGTTTAVAQAQKAVEAAEKAEAAYNNAKATAESIEAAVDEINKIPATLAQVQSLVMQAQGAQAAAATSATNAADSATAAANSAQGIADAEARAKAWAESSTSPDDAADADSATGKTQSSKSWALYAKDRATAALDAAEKLQDAMFEVDNDGNIMPTEKPTYSATFELDDSGDIMPQTA